MTMRPRPQERCAEVEVATAVLSSAVLVNVNRSFAHDRYILRHWFHAFRLQRYWRAATGIRFVPIREAVDQGKRGRGCQGISARRWNPKSHLLPREEGRRCPASRQRGLCASTAARAQAQAQARRLACFSPSLPGWHLEKIHKLPPRRRRYRKRRRRRIRGDGEWQRGALSWCSLKL